MTLSTLANHLSANTGITGNQFSSKSQQTGTANQNKDQNFSLLLKQLLSSENKHARAPQAINTPTNSNGVTGTQAIGSNVDISA